jgi:DNA helicase-2/ATP-dependent DNA helicase PcrA
LKENEDILRDEQQKATYLLVDEYQDINYSQWELIKLLSGGNPDNLFIVGDDYQSIYSFRGGDPKYIRSFVNDYAPNGIVRKLTKCYRCPPNIFKGAFQMVQKYNHGDPDLLRQITFAEKSNARIKLCTFKHHNLEANFIARTIGEIGPSYDTLILVPSANYTAPIKRELRKKFIKFSCEFDIEDTDLYLICLLLRWLEDPSKNFNFRMLIEKVINNEKVVAKAKREKTLQQISNFWKEVGEGKTLYTRVKTLKSDPLFIKLCKVITKIRKLYSEKGAPEFISATLEKLNLWQDKKNFTKEIGTIVEEMENLSMSSGGCAVRILTMKNAKGLEADYVFIVGVENNILPYKDANEEKKKEDSRLLYVSMTRAKKELYILNSAVRDQKITKVQIAGRSEFIDAIPSSYIVEEF